MLLRDEADWKGEMLVKENINTNRESEIKAARQILEHQKQGQSFRQTTDCDSEAFGVDIGTSKIVVAKKKNDKIEYSSQRNCFISVEFSNFAEKILSQNQINHHRIDNSFLVYGQGAEIFARMLNTETRRPMRKGLLNPDEPHAIEVIKKIMDDLIEASDVSKAKLAFSVPDAPKDSPTDIIYHEAMLRRHLNHKGFSTASINEGLAVVFSELEDENFTGLGISVGGGLCNVCLAYLSVPLISFSIKRGGDYLDDAVASVTGIVNTKVRSFKENGFRIGAKPSSQLEDALQVYYDDLISTLVKAIKESLVQSSNKLQLNTDQPIEVVLSGGTAMVSGFKERFEHFLKAEKIPLQFGKIRLAQDPLTATAKGALIAAINEN